MLIKEDYMQNVQLKPGYNAQISTKNQIIVNYNLKQNQTDTKILKPHLENHRETYGVEVFLKEWKILLQMLIMEVKITRITIKNKA
jgi:hypothetical protein